MPGHFIHFTRAQLVNRLADRWLAATDPHEAFNDSKQDCEPRFVAYVFHNNNVPHGLGANL